MQCYVTSLNKYKDLGGTMTDYIEFNDFQEFRKVTNNKILNVEIHITSEEMPLEDRMKLTKDNFMLNRNGKALRLFTHAFNIIRTGLYVEISCSWFKKYNYKCISLLTEEQFTEWLEILEENVKNFLVDPTKLFYMFNNKTFTPIPKLDTFHYKILVQY